MSDSPQPAAARDHATHDRLLVAGLADRRNDALAPADLTRARSLVASCPDCAALLSDLLSVAAATSTSAFPARRRDFTLTPADAQRLRPRGLRRLIGLIGTSRDVFSRPLAIGLTTIGLAGLLVGTVPGALPNMGSGGAASGPAAAPGASAAPAAAEPAPIAGAALDSALAEGALGPSPAASAVTTTDRGASAASAPALGGVQPLVTTSAPGASDDDVNVLSGAGEDAQRQRSERQPADEGVLFAQSDEDQAPSPLVLVSAVMILAGFTLFVLRWSRRQARTG